MKGIVRAVALALIGFIVVDIVLTGRYLTYVKPSLYWPLLVCGGVIIAMAGYEWVLGGQPDQAPRARESAPVPATTGASDAAGEHRPAAGTQAALTATDAPTTALPEVPVTGWGATTPTTSTAPATSVTTAAASTVTPSQPQEDLTPSAAAADHNASHDHPTSRLGWLYVLPFVLMIVVEPPALGAAAAQRDSGIVRPGGGGAAESFRYDPLSGPDPVPMALSEYSERAVFDTADTLLGRQITLTGFVSPVKDAPGWALTRMMMNCCAADGMAVKVLPQTTEAKPADNTWVTVVGRWVKPAQRFDPASTADPPLPIIQVETMRKIPAPKQPYE